MARLALSHKRMRAYTREGDGDPVPIDCVCELAESQVSVRPLLSLVTAIQRVFSLQS